MNARDYLTSSDSDLVIARCVAFTVLWICVRWVASNVVFSNVEPALRVRQGTKSVIVVHSAFQAIAAVWLVSYDPVVAPLLREESVENGQRRDGAASRPGLVSQHARWVRSIYRQRCPALARSPVAASLDCVWRVPPQTAASANASHASVFAPPPQTACVLNGSQTYTIRTRRS